MARAEMDSDFLLVNGDTLFEHRILWRLMSSPLVPITLTIDKKPAYDDDDMKVQLNGSRLAAVGKTLPRDETDGESIGLSYFRGEGPSIFAEAVAQAMCEPDGVRSWYLRVIDTLARDGFVHVASVEGLKWGEVDTAKDLENVRRLFAAGEQDVAGEPASLDAAE
jgi:choline kinase